MSQNTNQKRSLHCSFCDDEGHTINNCQDPQIEFLLKEMNESISLDIKCNFKKKYINYILSSYSLAEVRIIGYQDGLYMNKLSKNEFIKEIVDGCYDTTNDKYYEIINTMNANELNYFAKKIADSSKIWSSRKISLNKSKKLLGLYNKKHIDTKVENIIVSSHHDNDIDLQFYFVPFFHNSMLDEISPLIKNGLNYLYFLSIGAFLLNAYTAYHDDEIYNSRL